MFPLLLLLLLPPARTQLEKQIISKPHFGERSMHTYIENSIRVHIRIWVHVLPILTLACIQFANSHSLPHIDTILV